MSWPSAQPSVGGSLFHAVSSTEKSSRQLSFEPADFQAFLVALVSADGRESFVVSTHRLAVGDIRGAP
jgi:hypothetical protein